jgi:hypothetical protein
MTLSQGCPNGRRFKTELAAVKAVGKGADGKPFDCDRCGWWHLRVPEPVLGFSAEVKLLARIRSGRGDAAGAACEACGVRVGRHGGDIQHRVARGVGGCRDEVVNGLANAAVLCRDCHRKAEARAPRMAAGDGGWWIKSGKGPEHDPRFFPVLLRGEGERRWLSDTEPVYLEAAPGLEAA